MITGLLHKFIRAALQYREHALPPKQPFENYLTSNDTDEDEEDYPHYLLVPTDGVQEEFFQMIALIKNYFMKTDVTRLPDLKEKLSSFENKYPFCKFDIDETICKKYQSIVNRYVEIRTELKKKHFVHTFVILDSKFVRFLKKLINSQYNFQSNAKISPHPKTKEFNHFLEQFVQTLVQFHMYYFCNPRDDDYRLVQKYLNEHLEKIYKKRIGDCYFSVWMRQLNEIRKGKSFSQQPLSEGQCESVLYLMEQYQRLMLAMTNSIDEFWRPECGILHDGNKILIRPLLYDLDIKYVDDKLKGIFEAYDNMIKSIQT